MNPISNDIELGKMLTVAKHESRRLDELVREGKGYDLMKCMKRAEMALQLAQQRLAEIP